MQYALRQVATAQNFLEGLPDLLILIKQGVKNDNRNRLYKGFKLS